MAYITPDDADYRLDDEGDNFDDYESDYYDEEEGDREEAYQDTNLDIPDQQ